MLERKKTVQVNKVTYDLTTLDREQLLALKHDVHERLDSIKSQLYQAKAKVVTEGQYSDPTWYRRAEGAKRHLGRTMQLISQELRARRLAQAEVSRSTNRTFSQLFVDAARETLNPDLFDELIDEAKSREAAARIFGQQLAGQAS